MKIASVSLFIIVTLMLTACGGAVTPENITTDAIPMASDIIWQTYSNVQLGFRIEYPTSTGDVLALRNNHCPNLIPVKVVEASNQIILAQEYRLQEKNCEKGNEFALQSPLQTDSTTGQFTINYANAANINEVEKFIKKAYGAGCTLDTSSKPTDTDTMMKYKIITDNKMLEETTCPGVWGGNVSVMYNPKTQTVFTWKTVKRSFIDPLDTHSGFDQRMMMSFKGA